MRPKGQKGAKKAEIVDIQKFRLYNSQPFCGKGNLEPLLKCVYIPIVELKTPC